MAYVCRVQRLAILHLLFSILTLTAGTLFAQDTDESSLPPRENFHLFLLVGQSNMAGRGKITEGQNQPHPRVLMLTRDGKWAPAVDPLHFDKPTVVGVGVGRTFAEVIAEAKPDITIGLIPCAVGGSPISAWRPGEYYTPTRSHPWDDALRRARKAQQDGTLKGILWHQGESDSNEELAPVYEAALHDLIARFRSELDAPEVPFLAGQMGQFEERPWNEHKQQVDAAHQSLSEKVPHTAFVSSEGLKHKGDEVHFDADSYRELGRRYAKAYLQLVKPTPQ